MQRADESTGGRARGANEPARTDARTSEARFSRAGTSEPGDYPKDGRGPVTEQDRDDPELSGRDLEEEGGQQRPGGRRPVVVFLVMLAIIAAIVLVVLITRQDEPAEISLPPEPTLTEEQAKSELERLLSLRNAAFHDRDLGQLSSIYTASSPVAEIASTEITRLIEDEVFSKSTFETVDISLVSSSPDEAVLRQVVIITPRFVNEDGKNVTRDSNKLVQTVLWTLRREDGSWQIHDSLIEKSEAKSGSK